MTGELRMALSDMWMLIRDWNKGLIPNEAELIDEAWLIAAKLKKAAVKEKIPVIKVK